MATRTPGSTGMAGVFCFASGSKNNNNSQQALSNVEFYPTGGANGVNPVATSIHSKFKSDREVAHGENK
jgi:hypothetical protein